MSRHAFKLGPRAAEDPPGMNFGIGIDLVDVAEVRDALAAHGDRYLRRVYTHREQAECEGDPARLALRFAVKEATAKALGASRWIPWTSIESTFVRGAPSVMLSGEAQALVDTRGYAGISVSTGRLSRVRAGGSACATVVVR